MSNEITATISINVRNGNLIDQITETVQIDQTTARGGLPGFVLVGVTEELITLTDLVSPGRVFGKNLSDVDTIQWGIMAYDPGPGTALDFQPVGMLKPGEWDWWRLVPATDLYVKNTSGGTAVAEMMLRVYDD